MSPRRRAQKGPTLGERLRAVIKQRGKTIRDFSDELGIQYRSMQRYLAGQSTPPAGDLARLAVAGVDVNWLLTGARPIAPALAHALRRAGAGLITESIEQEAQLADNELLNVAWRQALDLATQFHQRRIDRGAKPLPVGELMVLAAYYYGTMLQLLVKVSRPMIDFARSGGTISEIAAMLAGQLGPQRDSEAEEACKSTAWE